MMIILRAARYCSITELVPLLDEDMFIFTARLHACSATHGRTMSNAFLSVCRSIRHSVRPSVKRVLCDKTKKTYAHILLPHERPFILGFWQEQWLVGRLLPPEILGRFSIDIRSYSACAVTPSEKSSINTNRTSITRFPMSLR